MNTANDRNHELPPAIAERLEAKDRSVSILTPEIDRAVLAQAREHFATRTDVRIAAYRRWVLPAAAAAAVLVALLLFVIPPRFGPDVAIMADDDVDGSGRVDVLDAFALARLRAVDPGRVSEDQIDGLMARIVSLKPEVGTL